MVYEEARHRMQDDQNNPKVVVRVRMAIQVQQTEHLRNATPNRTFYAPQCWQHLTSFHLTIPWYQISILNKFALYLK